MIRRNGLSLLAAAYLVAMITWWASKGFKIEGDIAMLNTDGYRGGYDASMHVSDYAIQRQDGYVPLSNTEFEAGGAPPNPTSPSALKQGASPAGPDLVLHKEVVDGLMK